MTTLQRYNRLRNEYNHYKRRSKMLHSITIQKRDELENLINHINHLLLLENQMNISIQSNKQVQIESYFCTYDHGDHSSISPIISLEKFLTYEESEDDDDDPLLQRLRLTKPSRLKTSSRQILNTNNSNILDKIHTVYDEYLSE
ncbi:unnamed protein product [Rotaria sordida]|uniref:Uncharacterized protein n=1 Tax=Rotaria sordida TaxID=392033 RepID=A0A815FIJ2_9BILA|nr:unnamed protein product [Rotaria sordida]CAF0914723.1 unnamed protein product [Rotaria sordida]CAF1161400.1 unnamed protein product [Rotaria sordida]CAF1329832.1 unnamed protein product [Rotaria sordida]CAF3758177.1 unnamed protein product [Rotaria sordida]